MSVRGNKNKGKRLQNTVTLKFRSLFSDILSADDIQSQTMGMSGADVVLSPSAKNLIPFDIECKNVETIMSSTMMSALEQAESNTGEGRIPLLIVKSNHQPERVVLKLDDFLALVYPDGTGLSGLKDGDKVIALIEKLKREVAEITKTSC